MVRRLGRSGTRTTRPSSGRGGRRARPPGASPSAGRPARVPGLQHRHDGRRRGPALAVLAHHPGELVGIVPDELQGRDGLRGPGRAEVGPRRAHPAQARRLRRRGVGAARRCGPSARPRGEGRPPRRSGRSWATSCISGSAGSRGASRRSCPAAASSCRCTATRSRSRSWPSATTAAETWYASKPLIGFGNIQPTVLRRDDGTLVAYMRENGPRDRIRVSESKDDGLTWGPVGDTELPNPGSGLDGVRLANGHWVLVYNDAKDSRATLAVSISEDEGRTWTQDPAPREACRRPVSLPGRHPGPRRDHPRHLQHLHRRRGRPRGQGRDVHREGDQARRVQ